MDISKLPIKDIYDLVKEGEIDPIKAFVVLKEIEKKSKEYKSKIEDIALDELSKYGREGLEMDGNQISIKRSAGRWSFKHIKEVVELENELKALKEKHKGSYKQIQSNITSIGEGGDVIDPAEFKEGKEIIQIRPKWI
tara:strand:+ start:1221 stop:1634 length:414 start_codon:yes stop_codon:yes gene_type:complete